MSGPSIADGLWKEQNEGTTVVAQMEGWLLRSTDPFPYLFLVALEAGSLIRAIALLLVYPLSCLLHKSSAPRSKEAALKLLVFIACAGLPLKDVEGVSRAVLPRFFAEDVTRSWAQRSTSPILSPAAPHKKFETSPYMRNELSCTSQEVLEISQ